jgi:DNA topoisomerase-2
LEKELKLTKSFSTNNMYLFGIDASPARYENTVDILLDFCDVRLEYYIKRREYLINKLTHELNILESKVRFIAEYIDGTLDINKKSKAIVCEILKKRKYYAFCDNENTESDENVSDYDYLVKMPIISLTSERIEDLTQQTNRKRQQLEDIQSKDHKQLWREDLDIIARKL